MTQRMIEYWVIPPEADAEFVANMEEVLEVYERPYDPAHLVLCMDEQLVQLLKETRVPITATKNHAKRVVYEYERNGTASIFIFAEPLAGFRQAQPVPSGQKSTGCWMWATCSIRGTPIANGSHWSWTT